jgi:MFS family permease
LAYSISSPFITPYLISKGFGKDEISYAMAFAPLVLIFMSVLIGQISDIIGRKRTISFSILIMALIYLVYIYMTKNVFLLIFATVVMSVAYSSFSSTSFSRIEDNTDDKDRGLFTGFYETMQSGAFLLGAIFSTYLIATFSIANLLSVSMLAIASIFFVTLFYKSHKTNKVNIKSLNFIGDIKQYLSLKKLRGVTIIGVAINFANVAKIIFIPLLLIQELHVGLVYVGVYSAVTSACYMTQFFWGRKCDLFGSRKIIILSSLVVSIGYISLAFAVSPMMVIASGVILGLSISSWSVAMLCYMSKVGEEYRTEGLVIGSYSSLANIGVALGYIVSGYLSVTLGTRFVFIIYGIVGIVAVILSRKMIRDE